MSILTVFLISGYTFFLGGVFLIAGCALPRSSEKRRLPDRLGDALMIAGAVLQLTSSIALPVAYFVFILLLLAGYGALERRRTESLAGVLLLLRVILGLLCTVGMGSVFPNYFASSIPWPSDEPMYIIGDSLSAGLEDEEVTWPEIVARQSGQEVVNLAAAGATVRTAQHQAAELPEEAKLLVLEIGGNDLLGQSSSREFEEGLEDLIKAVHRPGRRIVMFELPLPPFRGGFARVQHRLAEEFDVTLIPRHVLANAFLGKDTTSDGLHLSHKGHDRLAERVLELLEYSAEE